MGCVKSYLQTNADLVIISDYINTSVWVWSIYCISHSCQIDELRLSSLPPSMCHHWCYPCIYGEISSIRTIKSKNLSVSRLILPLSLRNPLKSGVKSNVKMLLAQRRQAMLQLHLNDQQVHCLQCCDLYKRFDDMCLYNLYFVFCHILECKLPENKLNTSTTTLVDVKIVWRIITPTA